MRILGATRLSHSTDASTSMERQREAIERYASAGGHTVTAITADTDVSGKVSPFSRPELAPWLNGHSSDWDVIVVTKIDRLTRNTAHLLAFVEWCQASGKNLISLGESIDLSTAAGRMFVTTLGMMATFERERIAERVTESRVKTRANGHWAGGQALPYGYRPVNKGTHVELAVDRAQAEIVNALALAIIGGASLRQACKGLNADGHRTAKGKLWDSATISAMLRNPVLRGYIMHDGQPVAGPDGMPLQREPVLDDVTWHRLQAALERLSRKDSGVRHGGSLLLQVAFTHDGHPLYMHRRPGKGDRYRTGPKVERSASFSADAVEEMVIGDIMRSVGDVPMMRKVTRPGSDSSIELGKVVERLAELDKLFTDGFISAERYGAQVKVLEARQAVLSATPAEPESVEYVPTGQSFREHWEALSDDERHTFLLESNVTATVQRMGRDVVTVTYLGELETLKAMAAAA